MADYMQTLESGSLRDLAVTAAKKFKSSWIELGRVLYTVWRDKSYKEWGYQQFESYVVKEVGIRKNTSLKLLRSYYFLEKEEPHYLLKEYAESVDAAQLPTCEAVDVLRQAKAKKIDDEDYQQLKERIFLKGKDSKEVKKDLTQLMRQREEIDPDEAWKKKRQANVKRFITTLKSLKREMEEAKSLPVSLAKQVSSLIAQLEDEIF